MESWGLLRPLFEGGERAAAPRLCLLSIEEEEEPASLAAAPSWSREVAAATRLAVLGVIALACRGVAPNIGRGRTTIGESETSGGMKRGSGAGRSF